MVLPPKTRIFVSNYINLLRRALKLRALVILKRKKWSSVEMKRYIFHPILRLGELDM